MQTLNVERVVLTPKYIDEITKNVPEDALDMSDGLKEVTLPLFSFMSIGLIVI